MSSGECSNVQLEDQRINLGINERMEFESKEEAFELYKEYAKSVGFTIITKASRRSRLTGKFIDAKFVCTRYGSKKKGKEGDIDTGLGTDGFNIPQVRKRGRKNRSSSKTDCKACLHVKRRKEGDIDTGLGTDGFNIPQVRKRGRKTRSSSKTDCKACLHVKRRKDGWWVIRTLIKEHNHEVQASSTRDLGGCKKLEKQNGASRKEMKSRKLLALEDGDVERLLNFFTDMQVENPFFFYAIDLCEKQSLRNIFWVDAKGRLDYTCFCDVVSIDTTFIKNEYKLPLIAFVGVNHHGQFLLLGSGLLLTDESKSGFVWLFQAWLKAMHGCQPRVILTNHDQPLKEAVSEAFPSSRHCYYMWDTLGQMPEKLGHVLRQEKNFMDEINDAVYGSCKSDEFEKKWLEVVDRFHVTDNVWLQSLYEDRQYWAPVYLKGVSLAGMCTAQRSDSVNSVFDKYIQRRTTLKAFLDQYKTMIQERYEEEEKAEIETLYKQPGLKSPSPFGKQMTEIYTREMFKKFQVEVLGGVACHPKKESEEYGVNKRTFRVQDYEQNRSFVVVWNNCESSKVVCSCRLFEFKGFLCRHALIVLQMSGELSIPSQYVLKRWTKNAKSNEAMESDQIDIDSTKVQRYTDLCLRSLKLSEEASLSEDTYNAVIDVLDEAFRKCDNPSNLIHNVEESDSVAAQDPSRHEERNNTFVENTEEEHSLQEVLSIGSHQVWKGAVAQEYRNRYSILDDYLSAQEMSHEMVRDINSMVSNRSGYCTTGQNMHSHSLGQSITQQRVFGTVSCSLNQAESSLRQEAYSNCFNMHEGLQDMVKDLS